MQRLDVTNLPENAAIYGIIAESLAAKMAFTGAFSRLFACKLDAPGSIRIKRLGIEGPIGSGKSTLGLNLLNAFGIETCRGKQDPKNRGVWEHQTRGRIGIYDNFSGDYGRFSLAQPPEENMDIVIVEHADLDRDPFDSIVMVAPNDFATYFLIVPEELECTPEFDYFLETIEPLLTPN